MFTVQVFSLSDENLSLFFSLLDYLLSLLSHKENNKGKIDRNKIEFFNFLIHISKHRGIAGGEKRVIVIRCPST